MNTQESASPEKVSKSSLGKSKTKVVSAEAVAAEQAIGAVALLGMSRADLMQKFGRKEGDSGSPEVQIALLTQRIIRLSEHFKSNAKDNHSRRGMMTLINRRKKLLAYLRETNLPLYRTTIGSLGLRK
jgi:small subunit ribosomal protein S15